MKSLIPSLLILAILLVSPSAANQQQLEPAQPPSPERRVALVVGNSAYGVARLRNPINDARAIAQTLRELGFEVIHREDLSQVEMKRSIKEFGEKIRRGGVGLFYYAGHGVQVGGENYLIPVDAAPESSDEVKYEAVNVALVLAQMASARNGMNIVILDACRNNPFARSFRTLSDGLAAIDAPSGMFIAYATAPGSVANDGESSRNGIYTQELLKLIKEPGLSIEEVFKRVRIAVLNRTQNKQTPWESSSLTGDFYFTLPKASDNSSSRVVEPSSAFGPASPKTSGGIANRHTVIRRGMQLVRYNNEPALAFSVRHIHGGWLSAKGCHGLLYVTQSRIIFEPTDKKHGFNLSKTEIKEAKAGNLSVLTLDTLGNYLVVKYGGESRRFGYTCGTEEKPELCSSDPFTDYIFNLSTTDFESAVKKFQDFAYTRN